VVSRGFLPSRFARTFILLSLFLLAYRQTIFFRTAQVDFLIEFCLRSSTGPSVPSTVFAQWTKTIEFYYLRTWITPFFFSLFYIQREGLRLQDCAFYMLFVTPTVIPPVFFPFQRDPLSHSSTRCKTQTSANLPLALPFSAPHN